MSVAVERKYPSTYPSDAVAILDAMSFSEGDDVKVIGSMSLRSQLYAGDYDADEDVKREGSLEKVLNKLADEFGDMMKRLQAIPKAVIGDIKCGSVEKYRVLPYKYADFHTMASLKVIDGLPLPSTEKAKLIKRLTSVKTEMDFILLKQDMKFHTVRWSPAEILHGSKKVQDGTTMTLQEAFQCPAPTKVDVIGWVSNNHYTEFSMVYSFRVNGKLLNDVGVDVEAELKEAVKYYLHEGNPFKAIKRQFALARMNDDVKTMERLSKTLNSDLGKIYSIVSDVGTLITLLEEGHPIGKDIESEVNAFKERMSHIYTLPNFLKEEEHILKGLNELVDKPTVKRLQMLEGLLMGSLAKHTPSLRGGLMSIEMMYPEVLTAPLSTYMTEKDYDQKDIKNKTVKTYMVKDTTNPLVMGLVKKMVKDRDRFQDLSHYWHNRDSLRGFAYRQLYYDIDNWLNKNMKGKTNAKGEVESPMVNKLHLDEAGYIAKQMKDQKPKNDYGYDQYSSKDYPALTSIVDAISKQITTMGRANIQPIPRVMNAKKTINIGSGPWGDATHPDVPRASVLPNDDGWNDIVNLLASYPNATPAIIQPK
jgi:hypothetical protein